MAEQIARNEEKGLTGRSIRIMACGIPNVGKSSFHQPGAGPSFGGGGGQTRRHPAEAVVRPRKGACELMDTPGMLLAQDRR